MYVFSRNCVMPCVCVCVWLTLENRCDKVEKLKIICHVVAHTVQVRVLVTFMSHMWTAGLQVKHIWSVYLTYFHPIFSWDVLFSYRESGWGRVFNHWQAKVLDWKCFIFKRNFCNRKIRWSLHCTNHFTNFGHRFGLIIFVPVKIPAWVKHSMVWNWTVLHMAPDPFRGALTIILCGRSTTAMFNIPVTKVSHFTEFKHFLNCRRDDGAHMNHPVSAARNKRSQWNWETHQEVKLIEQALSSCK